VNGKKYIPTEKMLPLDLSRMRLTHNPCQGRRTKFNNFPESLKHPAWQVILEIPLKTGVSIDLERGWRMISLPPVLIDDVAIRPAKAHAI
jgi:hypothetical protein